MATTTAPAHLATADEWRRPSRSLWSDAWHHFRRHRLAMAGSVAIALIALAVLVGPFLWPIPYSTLDYNAVLLPPSFTHPFGTDDLGHDLLARVLFGGRVSIAVGLTAVLLAITVGTFVGAVSGFFGGHLDNVLMRITDMFLSLPQLPLLLLTIYLFRDPLRAAIGPEGGIFILIVTVIGALTWMPTARLVRAGFLSLKEKEFVEAARTIGASDRRIIVRHILPNVMSPILVSATIGVGAAIITESALSFLGLGFPPDFPSWGRLLYDAQNYMDIAPQWAVFPGLAVVLTVLSINYIGDGLRDALDPRRTQR